MYLCGHMVWEGPAGSREPFNMKSMKKKTTQHVAAAPKISTPVY
jgi:hypothetical protein